MPDFLQPEDVTLYGTLPLSCSGPGKRFIALCWVAALIGRRRSLSHSSLPEYTIGAASCLLLDTGVGLIERIDTTMFALALPGSRQQWDLKQDHNNFCQQKLLWFCSPVLLRIT